ncbi:ATP-dependent helicase [Sediminitomix flava]|uniref:DNA 3'-5' helicase n=1 Tax=Sediminitomix flava TaxID=379075 RepID=A0A315Z7K6_SEDFL|nr:UvrD-helicase domain-containing protein [Sediminitomix flava]PWJ40222.1 DNA helicase-2/ATP-dependent DNA helicase PcrA [Sediminitomix flava]
MDYLNSLNEPQREAVVNAEGPMMIIAGAGSGKTRVLTYKIAYLMEKGVEPFNILALTFTNKAAREMRERIESVVGTEARNLWMGTFHSIFARILRYEADKLGYQSNFTIYDSDDSKSVIKSIIKEYKLDDKIYKPNGVLARISNAKNNLISWRGYANNSEYKLEDEASGRPKIADIFKEYALRCFKANAMDFDDLLYNTNVLLHKFPDVLNKYQQKFQYVMIDEFQDTNVSQYSITKKLAAVRQNICVVGDDAQSIYAFRGANIQNILNFEKDYPDLKVIKLEQNYRSSQNIVEAANSVIKHNQAQLKKNVWTSNDDGRLIDVIRATSDSEEAKLIATSIFEERMNNNLNCEDFAILYRTNSQSRSIEESLRKMNIPYRIIGGLSFYQRKEIKDMVAYLRFVINPADTEALKRIINYPKRAIGPTSVDKILVKASQENTTPWQIILNARRYFTGRLTTQLENFANMVQAFMLDVKNKDAFTAATSVAKGSGLLRELYDDKTVEGRVRYENLQELLNAVKAFVDDPEKEDKSLETFLQEVSLITSQDQSKEDSDAVTLMTIHMSKGLEYKHVYIAGMEENLFPSQMMLESRADLEEERRLFYVAITRAMSKLTLSYALQRYRFGKLIMCEPSRFLSEVDSKFLNVQKPVRRPSSFSEGQATSGRFGSFSKTESKSPTTNRNTFTSFSKKKDIPNLENFTPSNPAELRQGQNVLHKKFGKGTITAILEDGSDKRAKVNFDSEGEKTLILAFAKLMIMD